MSLLITVIAAMIGVQSEAIEPRLMRLPSIQGDTVVFTYASNLWVAKTEGGLARRLTAAPGIETRPFISPDGKTVAFTGQYEGFLNIYTIPIEGGEPKRLTYDPEGDSCLGWTPDGKIAYGSTHGNFINRQSRLWLIDPKGGMPQKTVINEVSSISYFPDGQTIAYTRAPSFAFNWRHYRGGTQGRISFYNYPQNKYWEIPSGREQSFFPMVVGKNVYYISDKAGGVQNLYRYDTTDKRDVQLTHYTGEDIRTPSTDGKTIAYELDGLLYLYDIASGQARKMDTKIQSEDLSARPYLRSVANQIEDFSLSPSGVRIAVAARGNLFSVPAKHGDTRNFTNLSGSRARYPNWSPDGQTIAYVTDATGNYEIYTQPQLGGTPTQLTFNTPGTIENLDWSPDGKYISFGRSDNTLWILEVATKKLTMVVKPSYGLGSVDWSPDSAWIAYTCPQANEMGALFMYEVATGKKTMVDSGYYNDGQISFDQNGKYLYLVSDRTFNPTYGDFEFSLKVQGTERVYVIPLSKDTLNPLTVQSDEEPTGPPHPQTSRPRLGGDGEQRAGPPPSIKVDFDGFSSRILPLPMPANSYPIILGSSNGVFYYNNGSIYRFDLDSKESVPVLSGFAGPFSVNQSRTKLAYYMAGELGVIDLRPGNVFGQGRVDTSGVEEIINPRDEWKQIYWEAWRYERDHYYDPNFRGLDWNAIGKQYSQYLKWVDNRADLTYVLGLMIGELGTSHSYVIGGDMGPLPRPIPIGQLGADFEAVGNNLRFSKIYRGHNFEESDRGPLAEPGVVVHEGDYLLAIDGKPVDANTNPASLLLDRVNRYVTLTVNSTPSMTGARTVRVRPSASEASIRYDDFVDKTREMVDKESNGRIGYMHIRDTAAQGSSDFVTNFFPQTDKDAIIVDERWNGGGYIQPWFVNTLARKAQAGIQSRNAADTTDERSIDGPKAMLINDYAGSGGDFFPWLFKKANLGPLIGTRTWGGLVGINERPNLVDGGIITAPEFSIYDMDTGEIIAENHGIDPDINVDERPDQVALGEDPQVEAAVKYLLDQLQKHPPRKPRVKFPTVNSQGIIHR